MTEPVKSILGAPLKNAPQTVNAFSIVFCNILIATIVFLSACNSGSYYQKKIELPDSKWAYSDTLAFQFSMPDTAGIYNIYVDIEHADTFSTQNVYMKLYTLFPDGKRLSKIKSFDLFDQQGKPIGACSGGKCRLHATLQEKAFFNSPGAYEITLEQYTREDPLPGIFSIGLTIESAGQRQ